MPVNESYNAWKVDQTPETLNLVVNDLKPTISYALSNLNATNEPVVKSEARLAAAKAVQNYDSSFGATIETHVSNSLRQLNRVVRKQRSPIRLPERAQLEAYHLDKSEKEYHDKHGKEPDLDQLADASGYSAKQINKIRKRSFGVVNEGTFGGNIGEEPDHVDDAVDYVYKDSDYKDKKIIEWKMGFGGAKEKTPQDIALALKIHPSQVSRRAAKILLKINEQLEAMEAIN